MKKILALLVSGLLLNSHLVAADGQRAETTGVDMHYQDGDKSNKVWSGSISYARLLVNNIEVGGAYTFSGTSPGDGTTQGLQLIGRQWLGAYPRANTVIPFVEAAVGLELRGGKNESIWAAGAGLGMFLNESSELRLTVKHTAGGFEDITALNVGYYYHF